MKKLIVVVLFTAIIAAAVSAQGMGMSGWASPQSAATQGRLRSPADDFIRPDSYQSARVENWFAMTSFASGSSVHLGYAKKLDNMYISAYYGGSFWTGINKFTYTETNVEWVNGLRNTVPVYASLPEFTSTPNNRFAVLVGIADMGFRLTLYSTYRSFKDNDIIADDIPFKNYEIKSGTVAPQIAWSLTKNLLDNGVRPWATLDLNFVNDYSKQEVYTGGTTNGATIENSQNYFEPVFSAGLGGYTIFNQSGFRVSADISYTLTLRSFNNDYDYWNGSSNNVSKIKGLNDDGNLSENKYSRNEFSPSVSGSWGVGNVAFRVLFEMPLTITSEESTEMTPRDTSGSLVRDGGYEKRSTVGFAPNLRLAAQWRLHPRLALNTGGRINISSMNRTVTNGKTYNQGNEVPFSSTRRVAVSYGSTSNQLSAGVTFNATDNMTFEAGCGIGNNNNISVFASDGIFSFASLLLSLKF